MRSWLVGGGIALALSTSAAFADGMPGRTAIYQPPTHSWTGFYFGGNVGYGWGNADANLDSSLSQRTRVFRDFGGPAQTLVSDMTVAGPGFAAGASADVDGWLGGGQIGYNIQSQRWVFGVEADIQWSSQDGSLSVCSTTACGAGSSFASASYALDWFGTLRGRVGYLIDPKVLLYVTGGLAYGHLSSDYSAGIVNGPSATFSDDKTKTGWVLGGGAEWSIGKNLSVKAEYLYMDLGDIGGVSGSSSSQVVIPNEPQPGFATVVDTTANAALRSDFTDHIFRIGLNYKFGERYAPLK